jgi:hypothetical protein
LSGQEFYCFLDGYSGYNQISVNPEDHEKTAFTSPFGVFAYRRMPFGLCNAPATFQRCKQAIFSDLIEKCIEVFMDDFSVFGPSFAHCSNNLDTVLKRCVETNLCIFRGGALCGLGSAMARPNIFNFFFMGMLFSGGFDSI